jgi:hypothetical protein
MRMNNPAGPTRRSDPLLVNSFTEKKTLCVGYRNVKLLSSGGGLQIRQRAGAWSFLADLSFAPRYAMKRRMEKIDPQQDHERLTRFRPGQQVVFRDKSYTIQRRTTLASGEAAVVLQSDKEQFVVGAQQFLGGVK